MAKMRMKYDDRRLRNNVENFDKKVHRALEELMERHALLGEQVMKMDAPWTDRTGAARMGLHCLHYSGGGKYVLVFAHSVHYGIWLEVKFSGRDAVIMPTILKQTPILLSDMRRLLAEL